MREDTHIGNVAGEEKKMMKLTEEQVAAMKAAQDAAAAAFWAYPSAEWQMGFQADWLQSQLGVSTATGPDGLVWGE